MQKNCRQLDLECCCSAEQVSLDVQLLWNGLGVCGGVKVGKGCEVDLNSN